MSEVQAKLLRILDSVRLERPSDVSNGPEPASRHCPNCGSEEPWGAASWCPTCGYFPKLGRAVGADEPGLDADNESNSPRAGLPLPWILAILLGIGAIVSASFALRHFIPDIAERSQWGLLQLAVGLVLFLTAHVTAFLIASQGNDTVTLSSLFFEPFRIWISVCKRLPLTSRILCLGSWGFVTLVAALFVVGLDWDGMFAGLKNVKRKKVNTIKAIVNNVTKLDQGEPLASEEELEESVGSGGGGSSGGGNSIESAVKDFAGTGASATATPKLDPKKALDSDGKDKGDEKKIPKTPEGEDRKDQDSFFVIGYLTNPQGDLRSLLLAEVEDDRGRFVCKLSLDEVAESVRLELRTLLDEIRSPRPALPAPYHARWVKPIMKCQVAFVGRTSAGLLKDGYLVSYDPLPQSKKKPRNTSPGQRETETALAP